LTKASTCAREAGVAVATIATSVDPFVATTPSLSFPPPMDTEKDRAWSPTPLTLLYATGYFLLKSEISDGLIFLSTSMITFKVWAWYSHTSTVAPGGNGDTPLGLTPTGAGTVTPRAVPTVAAVGHVLGAAVVVGSTGEVEATGDGDPAVVLPQAARVAVKTSAVSANRHELLSDTCNASFVSRRFEAIWLRSSFQPATKRFTPAMVQRSERIGAISHDTGTFAITLLENGLVRAR
jgi:hypothetical protein